MKALSLRTRLTFWSALATGGALVTFGLFAAAVFCVDQIKAVDRRMDERANTILGLPDAGRSEAVTAIVRRREEHLLGLAFSSGGGRTVWTNSPSIAEVVTLPGPPARPTTVRTGGHLVRFGRFAAGDRSLAVAIDLWPALDPVFDLLGAYLLALPPVLVVVGAGSWWIARRALQPISEMTRAAAAITADRLGARLREPPEIDEIGQHVRVLNNMLDRLQRSFEQARRFSADASHELRTPLTIMRGQIEEALRHGGVGPAAERLLVDLLDETSGLQKIADNLLLLARFDAGRNPVLRAPFDLSRLAGEVGEDAELLAAPRGITTTAEVEPAIWIDGDAVLLRRVALNLVDNAVKYNRDSGLVQLTLRRDGEMAVLMVGNCGPGIAADRRPDLFQRFFRHHPDRNSATGGSGLGLSICREIVSAHGGSIDLKRSESDWTEFCVKLPTRGEITSARPAAVGPSPD